MNRAEYREYLMNCDIEDLVRHCYDHGHEECCEEVYYYDTALDCVMESIHNSNDFNNITSIVYEFSDFCSGSYLILDYYSACGFREVCDEDMDDIADKLIEALENDGVFNEEEDEDVEEETAYDNAPYNGLCFDTTQELEKEDIVCNIAL